MFLTENKQILTLQQDILQHLANIMRTQRILWEIYGNLWEIYTCKLINFIHMWYSTCSPLRDKAFKLDQTYWKTKCGKLTSCISHSETWNSEVSQVIMDVNLILYHWLSNAIYQQWFQNQAARMFTCFPTGTTRNMCTVTKLNLIQGQVDTVCSAMCNWIQSHTSNHNASSNGCTSSLSISPLTNSTGRLKEILHDYVTKPCLSTSTKQGWSSTERQP